LGNLFKTSTVASTSARVSSFMVTSSSYGSPLKIIFGTTMVAPVLIDFDDFTAIATTTTTSSGGKGGSVKSSNTTYTYTVMVLMALGEGVLTGTGNIWEGSKVSDASSLSLTFFDGSLAQSIWGYLTTNHPTKAITYSGTSYLAGVIDLGDSSSLPNFNIEVYGLCESQQTAPSTVKVIQTAYLKTVEISNWSSSINVQEYVYGGTSGNYWSIINSEYYTIAQKKDASGNNIAGTYVYTFNFDDRTDGNDRADPLYIRVNYNAITASVSYTATDANPRDIITTLLTNLAFGVNFPSVLVDNMDEYSSYCQTNLLLLSPAYDSQQQVSDNITTLAESTNSEYVFSQGIVKMVPYYDNLTPLYDITDNNLIDQGDDTIVITRTSQSDVYNITPLEYFDRSNQYNTGMVYATDEGDIELHGLRQDSTKSHHEICTASLAQTVAQYILQKQLYKRNGYVFKVDQSFVLLEPMDPSTLTSALVGLGVTAIRVVSIKEDHLDYSLEITWEDNPSGVSTAPVYETQDMNRASLNLEESPGDINYPVIFEAPDILVSSGLGFEVWMYGSGGDKWGGANVWISEDMTTYKKIGSIVGNARQGILATPLQLGVDPDTANTPIVNLSMSDGALVSGTQNDADNFNTLCYVDGEFISYETATLTALNTYQLSYLRRGVYSSTIASHPINSQFVRMDDAVFKYPFTKDDIGKTIYIKYTSINIYGAGEQNLSDVSVYQYTIKGTSLTTPLPNVTALTTYYENGNMYISWTAINDFRSPIAYEIRKGDAWSSAEILGQTYNTKFQVQGNGNYFISAVYQTVYSTIPAEISITGARYTANVIVTTDERDTGWLGNKTTGLSIRESDNALWLTGQGSFDDITDVDSVANVDFYGGSTSTGTYTIPESHIVDIGVSSLCNVSVNYTAYGDSINGSFDLVDDVDSLANWDGDYSPYVKFDVQIRTAGDDGIWSNWLDFYVGQYAARMFDFRIILSTTDTNITAVVTDFSFSIDVPDVIESKNISIPAAGTTIVYDSNFHTIPFPQVTITDGISGDTVLLPTISMTKTGFFVQIVNTSGIGVDRRGSYLVQSY